MPKQNSMSRHIVLTSHPSHFGPKPIPISWGASDPLQRGPLIATLTNLAQRNVIGTHSGSYAIYRALAVASGALQSDHKADLTNTSPTEPSSGSALRSPFGLSGGLNSAGKMAGNTRSGAGSPSPAAAPPTATAWPR